MYDVKKIPILCKTIAINWSKAVPSIMTQSWPCDSPIEIKKVVLLLNFVPKELIENKDWD